MSVPDSDDDRTAGYQSWQKLVFVHWRVPAEVLQRLVPRKLSIEQFEGSAWIGIVPFSMERIRPWWSPAVPGISWFLETNVRTYVVDEHGEPGVWFFSLDANKRIAVITARAFWHLPYKLAKMSRKSSSSRSGNPSTYSISYQGVRREKPDASYCVNITPDESKPAEPAAAGTLDAFLVERYVLFAQRRSGMLMTGRVHHAPYRIQPVRKQQITQTLTDAMGCPISDDRTPDHLAYSPGVDVRVSPLRRHY